MIFFILLLPLAQVALGSIHQLPSGVNASLARHKRDLVDYICPRNIATGSDLGQNSYIIFHSPTNKADVIVTNENGKWSDAAMQLLKDNGFNSSLPTIIYSHGYHQSGKQSWLMTARARYHEIVAANGPLHNMLIFDWSNYSNLRYWTSVSYVPHFGNILGQFLEKLSKSLSYDLDKLHIVGYSLSTHIVGLAGRYAASIGSPVGQITALDPTGVCLHTDTKFARDYALQKTDAKFLVARHYNMFDYGARRPIGGVDIFVNGGKSQPMPPEEGSYFSLRTKREAYMSEFDDDGEIEGSRISVMGRPDHHRATEHETQALDTTCHGMAYECSSYESYLRGECADCGPDGHKCYFISNFKNLIAESGGEQPRPIPKYIPGTKMFIKTHYQDPFCLHQYQLLAELKANAPASTRKLLSSGLVELSFQDQGQGAKLSGPIGGQKFTGLASLESKLQQLNTMRLKVVADNAAYKQFLNSIDHMEINYMSHYSPEERQKASFRLCLNPDKTSLIKCPTTKR